MEAFKSPSPIPRQSPTKNIIRDKASTSEQIAIPDGSDFLHLMQATFNTSDKNCTQVGEWMEYRSLETIPEFLMEFIAHPDKIESQTHYKKGGKNIELPQGIITKLKLIVLWTKELYGNHGIDFHYINFSALSKNEFDNWRIHYGIHGQQQTISPMKTPSSAMSTSSGSTASASLAQLQNFRKGAKRDPSVYESFKDSRYHKEKRDQCGGGKYIVHCGYFCPRFIFRKRRNYYAQWLFIFLFV